MSKEQLREVYKDIALQAGGSHYPEVGGKTLEKFADLLVTSVCSKILASHVLSLGAKHSVVEEIKDHFQVNRKLTNKREHLDKVLFAMLGSDELVVGWWSSPNYHFNLSTPNDIWYSGEDGQIEVSRYILSHAYG